MRAADIVSKNRFLVLSCIRQVHGAATTSGANIDTQKRFMDLVKNKKVFTNEEYKVQEYRQYNSYSLYDFEIEMQKYRLVQPVPGVPDKIPETNPPPPATAKK